MQNTRQLKLRHYKNAAIFNTKNILYTLKYIQVLLEIANI